MTAFRVSVLPTMLVDPNRFGASPRALAALAGMLVVALALRWFALGRVVLIPEEAYYWMYAQHPDLGYFDHPPMVAWVIKLGTLLFGDTEFGVRVVGAALMFGTSALMYAFGRTWFGTRAGLLGAISLHVLPLYFGTGFIATMDAPLLFFWSLCLVGVSRALKGSAWGWYAAGVALGGALLSKYTGIFLAVGTVTAVVLHRPWRRHLRSAHPYLAIALAITLFSPVIIWNARHDWASFRFQFIERFVGQSFNVNFVLTFLLYQLTALTPLLLWGCVALYARVLRTRRRLLTSRWLVAVSFSLPMLSLMAYKSLRYEVHLNWTLPLFLSLMPALCQWFRVRMRASAAISRRRLSGACVWTTGVCIAVNVGLLGYLLTLQPRMGWLSAFGPWRELAAAVEDVEDRLMIQTLREPLVIACGKYRLASVLAFYRTPLERDAVASRYTTSQWVLGRQGLAFPFWAEPWLWSADASIYVDDDPTAVLADTQSTFRSVEVVDELSWQHGKKRYAIAVCRGWSRDGSASPGLGVQRERKP